MTTPYHKIAAFHRANGFTKGVNKGDAPIGKRSRSDYRVIKRGDNYVINLYITEVAVFTPDNKIWLDCDGWSGRPTTQKYLNDALRKFGVHGVALGTSRVFSHKQDILYVGNHTPFARYRYYDGIAVDLNDDQPKVATELHRFERKQLDKQQVAEFVAGYTESGFKAMFKVLHDVSMSPAAQFNYWERKTSKAALDASLRTILADNDYAEKWPEVIQAFAFERRWDGAQGSYWHKHDATATWTRIMRAVKKHMNEVVRTDIYVA